MTRHAPMNLRQLLRQGSTIGGWCAIPSSLTAELMSRAGYDWVCIDAQHGPVFGDSLLTMLQAAAIAGTPTLVRVPSNDSAWIGRALDAGASGVIVPMVESAEAATAAVVACRYPPEGVRSYSPTRATWDTENEPVAITNTRIACVIMIESDHAIERLDEILSVPGIDAVFVGPADLASSVIHDPTAVDHRSIAERLAKIAIACARHSTVVGAFCRSVDDARELHAEGFRMLALQSDLRLLRQAVSSSISELRAGLA